MFRDLYVSKARYLELKTKMESTLSVHELACLSASKIYHPLQDELEKLRMMYENLRHEWEELSASTDAMKVLHFALSGRAYHSRIH